MCQDCVEQGIDVEEQRKEIAKRLAEDTGLPLEDVLKVLLSLEDLRERVDQSRRRAIIEAARQANPDLFAMLDQAGAEFAVEEGGRRTVVEGEPKPAPAHIRDIQGSGGYL